MPSTVQTIIELATVASTANDAGKLATDAELIAVLDRHYQAYAALMALSAPERWVATAAIAWSGTPATFALPADLIDIRHVETSGGAEIRIVPVEERRKSWHTAPAAFRQSGSLVSRAQAGDPVNGESGTLWYLDAPTALSALGNSLDSRWPVRHDPLLIGELAVYLANKDQDRSAEDRKQATASRDSALAFFQAEFRLTHHATESPHNRRAEGV